MTRLLTTLILLCLLTMACGLRVVTTPTHPQHPIVTTPTQIVGASPTLPDGTSNTPSPTPTPFPSVTPAATPFVFRYETIYQQGGFSIRRTFLGKNAIWRWDNFPMPPERIKNSVQDLGLGRNMICDTQSTSITPCSQTLTLPGPNEYTLQLTSVKGGSSLLTKNGKLLWTGITNGADSFAILTSKPIEGELVFDYSKSNWGKKNEALWIATSILITNEKTVRLIPDGFAPNVIDGKLIYFRTKDNKKITLIYDGQEVGEPYNDVFNLLCCWHGPQINIVSDGKIIDFFAQKSNGWYHVQAGYLAGEQMK